MRSKVLVVVLSFLTALPTLRAQIVALLRAGDVFDLRLGGVPQEYAADFAQQYTIDQDGTVNLPLIGKMNAGGLRPAQLSRTIEARLTTERIYTRPTVLINVVAASRYVSIHGGVRMPQRLPWSGDVTLSSAIGDCGGLTDFARGNKIRLVRDERIIGVYRLKDFRDDPSKDPKLLPGDQVIVPE